MKRVGVSLLLASIVSLCALPSGAASEAPRHVLIGMHQLCYEAPCYHSPQRVPLQEVARWISWAYADRRVTDEARRLGIKTYAYIDPSLQYDPHRDSAPLYSDDEATFLRACNGARATVRRGNLPGFLMDQGAASYRTRVRRYVDEDIRGHYDALFVDDTFAATDTYATVTNKPCRDSFDAEREKTYGLWQDLDMPVIFNKLGDAPDDGRTDQHGQSALGGPNVIGAMYEFCLSNSDDSMDHTVHHKRIDGAWLSAENSHLQTVARDKYFFCYSASGTPGDTPAGIDERSFVYASFLLVYRPDRSVLEMSADTAARRVPAFPESEIVALDPVRSQPQDVRALRSASGTYVREYRRCSLAGRPIGPCAAVVNPSPSFSTPVDLPAYRHALALRGGAIPDGGTLRTDAPAPTRLPRASGTILFR
jgi:hypothetical protein